jgi:cytochrome P450
MPRLLSTAPAQNLSDGKPIPLVRTRYPLESTFAFQHDPLHFLSNQVRHHGDIFRFQLLTLPVVVLNHPHAIKRVLLDHQANYDKDVLLFQVVKPVLRNGLIAHVGGEEWLRHRRMIQPAFHHRQIAALVHLMTEKTLDLLQRWETKADQDEAFDVTKEMGQLSLQIALKSFLRLDLGDPQAEPFQHAFLEAYLRLSAFVRFPFPPLNWPLPSHRRVRKAIQQMDAFVSEMITQHRQREQPADDLLSSLLHAVDEGTGEIMSEQQLHHELLNMLIGSYETTAYALTFLWYVLARYPDVESRLHAELDTVLAGRCPQMEDLANLPYTHMVINETLRLYPPAWQTMRHACEDDEIDGYALPAGTALLWNHYALHRHPAFWDNPEQFLPERFANAQGTPESLTRRFQYAYMPFGYGSRVCIGNVFALTEIQLVLATIAQRYRLRVSPEYRLEPVAYITLRPKKSLLVRLERRS